MPDRTIIDLVQKFLREETSLEEEVRVARWVETANDEELLDVLDATFETYTPAAETITFAAPYLEEVGEALTQRVQAPVRKIRKLRTWLPYAAAIIILFGVGTYLYITNQKEKPSVTQTNPVPVQNDVAPGGNRATLTLADGSKIILDSATSGELAREENATITKTADGKIVYDPNEKLGPKILYNTMATPRGGQFQLTLPDGTQVWLNAESSITYPTAFAGNERRVTITGEAYFEVASDRRKPFLVECQIASHPERPKGSEGSTTGNTMTIQVLGTQFNINTYREEPTIKTTLVEGSVLLTTHYSLLTKKAVHTSLILKPGQQGQLNPRTEKLSLAANPDVEQAVAWKNGVFNFNNTDVEAAMRQLSRWYDVTIDYDGKVPKGEFGGEIGRNLNLSQVLKVLDGVVVRLKLEGRTLHVSDL